MKGLDRGKREEGGANGFGTGGDLNGCRDDE